MSRPHAQLVDDALDYAHNADSGLLFDALADEVKALRNELAYERTLRNGLERMLKTLDTQLTAADEVLP